LLVVLVEEALEMGGRELYSPLRVHLVVIVVIGVLLALVVSVSLLIGSLSIVLASVIKPTCEINAPHGMDVMPRNMAVVVQVELAKVVVSAVMGSLVQLFDLLVVEVIGLLLVIVASVSPLVVGTTSCWARSRSPPTRSMR